MTTSSGKSSCGDDGNEPPLILHVPFTFFPEAGGGTEVYVRSLAKNLSEFGFSSAVAAPGRTTSTAMHEGLAVYRFATRSSQNIEHAYGAPDETAARGFLDVIRKVSPAIVHLHARTAAVSERLVDLAKAHGAKVVFTYHTPTVSCARGTMLFEGKYPCDGRITHSRCVACALAARGASPRLAKLAATVPPLISSQVGRLRLPRPLSALRTPGLIAKSHAHFMGMMSKSDRVVAVCNWVADVLRCNGILEPKLVISRQGIADTTAIVRRSPDARVAGPFRIGYFGRTHPTKGIDLIPEAFRLLPNSPIEAYLHLINEPGTERYAKHVEDAARQDNRIQLRQALPPNEVIKAMTNYDLIVVPSRWLETGPLVVLEAHAAGVPVIGAKRGGIGELVRDGIDGLLFDPDNAHALAATLKRVVDDPILISTLSKNVPSARTMRDVTAEMASLYLLLLSEPKQKDSHLETEYNHAA